MNKVVIPKESNETKKLKEEDKVSDALLAQAKEKAEIASQAAKEETQKQIDVSSKVVITPTKKEFAELIDRYEEKNPIKYAAKKSRLAAKLASL